MFLQAGRIANVRSTEPDFVRFTSVPALPILTADSSDNFSGPREDNAIFDKLSNSLHELKEFIPNHQAMAWWLGIVSIVMFVGTLLLVPVLVVKIPEDYFTDRKRHIGKWDHHHVALRWTLIVLKNIVGALLIVAGIAMMMLPGQGAITLLIGVVLLDFPGKFRLERWIIGKKPVHRAINWIRKKRHHPPLQIPGGKDAEGNANTEP